MKKCYDCTHVEMCGWRKEVKEQGCEFFDDGMVWIPVSERLPKINTPVILAGKYNEVIGYRRNNSDWMALAGDGWETDIEHPEDFMAWMPLPKPYREDDELNV